jgi:hypothetical protein
MRAQISDHAQGNRHGAHAGIAVLVRCRKFAKGFPEAKENCIDVE